jgi:hypothetical protein
MTPEAMEPWDIRPMLTIPGEMMGFGVLPDPTVRDEFGVGRTIMSTIVFSWCRQAVRL